MKLTPNSFVQSYAFTLIIKAATEEGPVEAAIGENFQAFHYAGGLKLNHQDPVLSLSEWVMRFKRPIFINADG